VAAVAFEASDGGVEVLCVARVGEPDGRVTTEDVREPEDLGGEKVVALLFRRVVEDEDLLLHGVVAGGDGDGLAVAGLDELELALVEGFANSVVDEAFGEGLLEREDDGSEGLRERGRDHGMQLARETVFEADVAVDDEGVGTGG